MRIKAFIFSTLILFAFTTKAQEKSKGRAFAKIFANFHSGINDKTKDIMAFELLRGYIGYEYQFDEHFYGKVNLDIASPSDLPASSKPHRYAYFKNAYLRYTANSKFNVEFGLISLKYFKAQEKIWARRYISKVFSDKYHLNSSADLGMNLHYNLTKKLSADFTITNGEGYNRVQMDDVFKYGLNLIAEYPKGFLSSVYYDFTKKEIAQSTISLFTSYSYKNKWNIAAEWVYRSNHRWQKDNNKFGYSFFGKYNIYKKYQLFARYDIVRSNTLNGQGEPWDLRHNGSTVIAGLQYAPIRNIKMALNYQGWYPWKNSDDNNAFIYLNLEVKM